MEEIRLLSEEASEAALVDQVALVVDQVAPEDPEDQDDPEDGVGPEDEVGPEALERNIQAKLLELESQAEAERSKLAQIRRQHYKTTVDSGDEVGPEDNAALKDEIARGYKYLEELEENAVAMYPSDVEDEDPDDEDWQPPADPPPRVPRVPKNNMVDFRIPAQLAQSATVSVRGTMDCVNGWSIATGLVTPGNTSMLVSRQKVWNAMKKVEAEAVEKRNAEAQHITCIYYDSSNNKCFVGKEIDGRVFSEYGMEDVYVMVSQPGDKFVGNFVPRKTGPNDPRKKAKICSDTLNAKCQEYGIPTDQVICLGGDSTALNTGHLNGIHARLEREWGHRVNWVICFLHILECHLKHLVMDIDGTTAGPNAFKGKIGKILAKVETLPLNPNFTPIPFELPEMAEEVLANMNSDQKALWKVYSVIESGVIPPNYTLYKLAALNHVRWNSTATRIGRLYICDLNFLDDESREKLDILVNYVGRCYLKVWFRVRRQPLWTDIPNHFLFMLEKLRELDTEFPRIKVAIEKSVNVGAYSLHSEIVLQTMLSSEDEELRRDALLQIRRIRTDAGHPTIGDMSPRDRQNPEVNFAATSIKTLTVGGLDNAEFEPILTSNIQTGGFYLKVFCVVLIKYFIILDDLFAKFLDEPMPVPAWPSHTQSVERCIQMAQEAGKHVRGEARRDGRILSIQETRSVYQRRGAKEDYTDLVNQAYGTK